MSFHPEQVFNTLTVLEESRPKFSSILFFFLSGKTSIFMRGNRDEFERNKQTMNVALKASPSFLGDRSSLSQDLPSATPSCPHLCPKPPVASTTLQVKLRGLTVAQRPCRSRPPPSSPVSSPHAPYMDPAHDLLCLQLNFPSHISCAANALI